MRSILAEELVTGGLGLDQATREYEYARVLLRGEMELRKLRRSIPLNAGELPPSAMVRLGYGNVLTEWAISSVSSADSTPVLTIGAVANLTVTTFDNQLDNGGHCENASLARKLARHYFELVERLPCSHGEIRKCISRAVDRMYQSEIATIQDSRSFCDRDWRRKCALPFVAMALPVWLTIPDFDRQASARHLSRLYHCGEFFGWIDDAVDLESDAKYGRPNHVAAAMNRGADPRRIATRIVERARRLVAETDASQRNCLLSAVWAWVEK